MHPFASGNDPAARSAFCSMVENLHKFIYLLAIVFDALLAGVAAELLDMKIDGRAYRTIWPTSYRAIEVIDQTRRP